jgi:CO/xanthine dehydrogenase Mo-binding subunit
VDRATTRNRLPFHEFWNSGQVRDQMVGPMGAEFVEVRVHERTREIRCPRVVGAFAADKIVNPLAAESQVMGGLIWGVSSALHEATEIDRGATRYYNTDLAVIPVNTDIDDVKVIMVNELGIKGLGGLGDVGTDAAVANAVPRATRIRIRELSLRLEKLGRLPPDQAAVRRLIQLPSKTLRPPRRPSGCSCAPPVSDRALSGLASTF